MFILSLCIFFIFLLYKISANSEFPAVPPGRPLQDRWATSWQSRLSHCSATQETWFTVLTPTRCLEKAFSLFSACCLVFYHDEVKFWIELEWSFFFLFAESSFSSLHSLIFPREVFSYRLPIQPDWKGYVGCTAWLRGDWPDVRGCCYWGGTGRCLMIWSFQVDFLCLVCLSFGCVFQRCSRGWACFSSSAGACHTHLQLIISLLLVKYLGLPSFATRLFQTAQHSS